MKRLHSPYVYHTLNWYRRPRYHPILLLLWRKLSHTPDTCYHTYTHTHIHVHTSLLITFLRVTHLGFTMSLLLARKIRFKVVFVLIFLIIVSTNIQTSDTLYNLNVSDRDNYIYNRSKNCLVALCTSDDVSALIHIKLVYKTEFFRPISQINVTNLTP